MTTPEPPARHVLVRYRTTPEHVDENERLVRAVFAELERTQPAGLRYAALRSLDGGHFVHLAAIETPDGANPLLAVDAFRAFASGVGGRCLEPPVTNDLSLVGAYRMLRAKR